MVKLKNMHKLKGTKQTLEHKEKRLSKIRGKKRPPFSDGWKNKISAKMKVSAKKGADHYEWKGDNVGYRALHRWIENYKGKPTNCEIS